MIDVDIRLETDVIIRDRVTSEFKILSISTIIGKANVDELDSCGDNIIRLSSNERYPNEFAITSIDTNADRLQVLVKPASSKVQYLIYLDELGDSTDQKIAFCDLNASIVEEFIRDKYK